MNHMQILEEHSSDEECYLICELLAKKTGFKQDAGFFMHKGKPCDHSWLKDSKGTIYDPTYFQFDRRMKVGVFPKEHPIHKKYHSWDTHHNPHCLHEQLKITYDECQICGYIHG